MLSSIRRRKRTVSVGPQSEADARELIATQEQQRREGRPAGPPTLSPPDMHPSQSLRWVDERISDQATDSPPSSATDENCDNNLFLKTSPPSNSLLTPPPSDAGASSDSGRDDDRKDRVMFSILEKPRIRYDVEVITKLIVYAG